MISLHDVTINYSKFTILPAETGTAVINPNVMNRS